MSRSSTNSSARLLAICLLLLSFFNITLAQPLDQTTDTVHKRDTSEISVDEYVKYLQQYFPNTDHYLEYTGESEDQIRAFKAANPGYHSYTDLFDAVKFDANNNPVKDAQGNGIPDENHPWYKFFHPDRLDNGYHASEALARVASGEVRVFGGIEWQTLGMVPTKESTFAKYEVVQNHARLRTGQVRAILHMAKGATRLDQVMASEDADGKMTFRPGFKAGDKNATGRYVATPDPITPKNSPPTTPKGTPPTSPKFTCRKI